MSDLPPPDAATIRPVAQWRPDPADARRWRWHDGSAWSTIVTSRHGRIPRLPGWLSPPVLACGVLVVLIVGLIGVQSPIAVVAGLIPLVIVLPVLSWLDRVEPEPRPSRIHALLWGGTVAIVVSWVANTVTAWLGGEIVAMVVSAPVVEEATKALGIVWAVRRREVDGISDGIVYAGWVALGFAVVEDMTYFWLADIDGALVATIVLRAFLTPFAHPLFTFWSGWAIGRAVFNGRPVWPAMWWGLALAILTHAMWNGTLALGDLTYSVDERIGAGVLIGGIALFVALFVAVAIGLRRARRREQRRFVDAVGGLVLRYGIPPAEAEVFGSWQRLVAVRKALPRRARRDFDRVHAALARLAVLHERPGEVDHALARVFADEAHGAVADLRRSAGGA